MGDCPETIEGGQVERWWWWVRCADRRGTRARLGALALAGHGTGCLPCPGGALPLSLSLTRESFWLSRRSFRSSPGENTDFCSASRPCLPLFRRVLVTLQRAACTFFGFRIQ
uniref:Uncharacterized protein n=1 Tax=Setaria viridis TaxID=4556 RepID=A0A4U6VB25_SETVI|nr:hypothetical protein SEVIR_3G144600v2 [Setaria viridis]